MELKLEQEIEEQEEKREKELWERLRKLKNKEQIGRNKKRNQKVDIFRLFY